MYSSVEGQSIWKKKRNLVQESGVVEEEVGGMAGSR
jgi:hypothetical protein